MGRTPKKTPPRNSSDGDDLAATAAQDANIDAGPGASPAPTSSQETTAEAPTADASASREADDEDISEPDEDATPSPGSSKSLPSAPIDAARPSGPAVAPSGRLWVVNPSRPLIPGGLGWVLRFTAYAALWLVLGAGIASVAVYRYFAADLPPLEHIESYQRLAPGVTRLFSAEGAVIAELAREHRAYAPYDDIPSDLVHAFLAAEDRRFFEHGGLDVRGLGRAVIANLRSGTVVQGGSTITQQVAKGFLTDEQTLARKLREAILSIRVESRLSKEQILEIYLNKIFLGHSAYGVGAAASRYFDKKLGELTLAECALIAGLARAPSRYSPVANLEGARARRAVVLQDMVEAGYIDAAARDAAAVEPIVLAEHPDLFRARSPYYAEAARARVIEELGEDVVLTAGLQIETALDSRVQAMAAAAVDRGVRKLDESQGFRGPVAHLADEGARAELRRRLAAHYGAQPLQDPERWVLAQVTDINKFNAWVTVGEVPAIIPLRNLQWASKYDRNSGDNGVRIGDAREALEVGDVVWVARTEPFRGKPADPETPDMLEARLGQTPRIEAALFTAEHDTGYVIAVQGGQDYDRSQFIRPTQGCRQPGSVFKAIYYAYALDTGKYSMDSELDDKAYEPEPGEEWNPQNIHGTLEGRVLLRNAFIHSLNLPSIRLFMRLGADEVVTWARRLGFTTELIADRALSLGASCVRMDEMSRAFAIYVQEGRSVDLVYVRRAIDKNGEVRIDHRFPTDGAMDVGARIDAMGRLATTEARVQVIDRGTAFLITRMLRDVVTSGIGRRAQRVGVPAGGKSGTASKNEYTTDTWFVGFTARHVTAAWMGDDKYERSMGDEEASYTTATPMWTDYMTSVVEGIEHGPVPLRRPPGIRSRSVQFESGGGVHSAVMYSKGVSDASDVPDAPDPDPRDAPED
jgi:penicillin-binding protein 1A